MKRESVLYLIPLLSSPSESMKRILDQLNIKEDHSTTAHEQRVELYPRLGQPITEVWEYLDNLRCSSVK